eukprot:Partr_v1_DN28755_c0_g1_i1_m62954 putative Son of sevenless homolog
MDKNLMDEIIHATAEQKLMHQISTDNDEPNSLDDQLLRFAAQQWKPSFRSLNELSGWLNKRGKGAYYRRWQSRYLVLKDGSLFYFRRHTDPSPAGVLFIDSSSAVVDASEESACDFCFSITVNSSCSLESRKSYQRRTYHFAAANQRNYDDWMMHLSKLCGQSVPTAPRRAVNNSRRMADSYMPRHSVDSIAGQYMPQKMAPRFSVSTILSGSSYESSSYSLPFSGTFTSANNSSLDQANASDIRGRTITSRTFSSSQSTVSPGPGEASIKPHILSQNLYTVFLSCKSQIVEFSDQLKSSLESLNEGDSPLPNYVHSATAVIRQVRHLLYFVDTRFAKTIKTTEWSQCISRHITAVVDKIRQIGLHSKQLMDDDVVDVDRLSTTNDIVQELDMLVRELHALINASRGISDLYATEDSIPMLFMGMAQPFIERCDELLGLSIDFSNSLNTFEVDDPKQYVLILGSFCQSMNEIWDVASHALLNADINFNFESQQNRLMMDAEEYGGISKKLTNIADSLLKCGKNSELTVSSDSVLLLSESFFCGAGFVMRLLVTLGFVERRLRSYSESALNTALAELIASVNLLTLTLPPQEVPEGVSNSIPIVDSRSYNDPEIVNSHPIRTLASSLESSLNLDMSMNENYSPRMVPSRDRQHTRSFDLSERPDQSTLNHIVLRTVSELARIAIDCSRSMRTLLTSCTQILDNEISDSFSQLSIGMTSTASQIEEELASLEGTSIPSEILNILEQAKSSMMESSASFLLAQRNWLSMISPSVSRSRMIDSTVMFENQCVRVVTALETLSLAEPAAAPPTPPLSPITVAQPTLDSIAEDEETPEETTQKAAMQQVEELLEIESESFRCDPDIVFRTENMLQIKGGTLEKLVEKLTFHRLPSSHYTSAFLLTYRSFTSASELLTLLIKRYNIEPPPEIDGQVKSLYFSQKIIPVRLRVFNVIKMWIKNNYEDFEKDAGLLQTLYDFLPTMRVDFHKGTTDFQAMLGKKQLTGDVPKLPLMKNNPPTPILPKNMDQMEVLSMDVLETARQLTLIQWNMFFAIRPNEFLNQAWNRPKLHDQAANLREMIQFSNYVIEWVTSEIMAQLSSRQRALVIRFFISMADKLRGLNNFECLKCVLCALETSGVRRLKKSWEQVPSRFHMILDELSELMSQEKSCKNYRHLLHTIDPPCIPFIGVYLTDLTMIESGNPDYLKEQPNLINFHKRYLIAQVIQEFKQYQGMPYCLTKVDAISTWLTQRHTLTSEEAYDRSLQLEPRAPQPPPPVDEIPAPDAANLTQRRTSGATTVKRSLLNLSSLPTFRSPNSPAL